MDKIWHDTIQQEIIGHNIKRHNTTQRDMTWNNNIIGQIMIPHSATQLDTIWYDSAQKNRTWHDTIWNMSWQVTTWYIRTWHHTTLHNNTQNDAIWYDMALNDTTHYNMKSQKKGQCYTKQQNIQLNMKWFDATNLYNMM